MAKQPMTASPNPAINAIVMPTMINILPVSIFCKEVSIITSINSSLPLFLSLLELRRVSTTVLLLAKDDEWCWLWWEEESPPTKPPDDAVDNDDEVAVVSLGEEQWIVGSSSAVKARRWAINNNTAVSYTHLTLPTKRIV
eukprot:TRINITY_DN32002_c0_g1_i1.p1 TRINITY_DN32002_c0_g1~~TRINITY_DN32002_c0_g1_i1.p1  ORF type:complete len:140 (+),score=25.65 TRINITY_DN32002_c0_g1_i1:266-685(+)